MKTQTAFFRSVVQEQWKEEKRGSRSSEALYISNPTHILYQYFISLSVLRVEKPDAPQLSHNSTTETRKTLSLWSLKLPMRESAAQIACCHSNIVWSEAHPVPEQESRTLSLNVNSRIDECCGNESVRKEVLTCILPAIISIHM